MITTDPIADFLTRIRNALMRKEESVTIPASTVKKQIAKVLVSEGFIAEVKDKNEKNGYKNIVLTLKYGKNGERVIQGLKRISKPGLRIYASVEELPKVLSGLGIAVISTSKGIMSDKVAREKNIGGEVLAYVW